MSDKTLTDSYAVNHRDITASSWVNSPWKRAFDVACASTLLCAFSPLMAAIAIGVKFDSPGDILFRQNRIGRDGKPFTMYKFRTLQSHMADPSGSSMVTQNDPRVTKLGRFLRKTRLDELPQFINVLAGDMAMVGPRPLPEKVLNRQYEVHEAFCRNHIKPGLTLDVILKGYRNADESTENLNIIKAAENDYIQYGSFLTDLKTVWRTPQVMINPPASNC